jgi:hypothetical protein
MRADKSRLKAWLDDRAEHAPPAHEGWTIVRSPQEVIYLLEAGEVETLSLDQDLALWEEAGPEITGDSVVRWLMEAVVSRVLRPPKQDEVYSGNPAGRGRMEFGIAAVYRRWESRCRSDSKELS